MWSLCDLECQFLPLYNENNGILVLRHNRPEAVKVSWKVTLSGGALLNFNPSTRDTETGGSS